MAAVKDSVPIDLLSCDPLCYVCYCKSPRAGRAMISVTIQEGNLLGSCGIL